MSKAQLLVSKSFRGATMIEYALVIIAIMFFAAVAFRKLGNTASVNADKSETELGKSTQGN